MWRQWELERGLTMMVSDDALCSQDQGDHLKHQKVKEKRNSNERIKQRNVPIDEMSMGELYRRRNYWMKKLFEVEEGDAERWGHQGYKELYPEEFNSPEVSVSDSTKSSKEKHKRKKKKRRKKCKRESSLSSDSKKTKKEWKEIKTKKRRVCCEKNSVGVNSTNSETASQVSTEKIIKKQKHNGSKSHEKKHKQYSQRKKKKKTSDRKKQ
ncbi:uncharacterized protein C11orf57-like isoform X1 [Limulus polyphemus]|uniref:Uncharacterized protein C11orf57-like isoform X1 n=1 Tax=Limulus polyphemus TaxID=6850 RepID=A0ABM1T621_LIMPO|nr:uncharacterized protein C11orf57-like isoform X1 [Limulus polyphemus]XP_022251328.1 uncharacterized protein C11orf57-like isoform X1 [Limulus polyphemus]